MFERNSLSEKILFLKFGLVNVVLFLIIYIPLNQIEREDYINAYFQWELGIPLIGWMIIPYHFFNLLFLFPLFVLRSRSIYILGAASALSTIIAGIIFMLFPTQLGFERIAPPGFTENLYLFLFKVDRTTNLLPSLHVTYTTLYFMSCITYFKSARVRLILSICTIFVMSSVLFTHQHHVLDIISAIILACSVFWFVQKYIYGKSHPSLSDDTQESH